MKKYVVIPGYVRSPNDGDEHYITPTMLARLFRVPLAECIIIDSAHTTEGFIIPPDLPVLRPRNSGNYDLERCFLS